MRRRLALVLTAAAAAACAGGEPAGPLRVSGHVEATEVRVAADVAGQLLELRVQEGDRVAAGAVVALLDTTAVTLQLQRAHAERRQADAQLRLLQAGAPSEDIRQADAFVESALTETSAAATEMEAARADLARYDSLLRANAGSQKQRDDAQARVDLARDRHQGASERVRAAREALARLKAGARPQELDAARARVAAVDAEVAILEDRIERASVRAPLAGIATQRLAEPGEFLAPLAPILVITDLDRAWANVFVPEPVVPRLMLGQRATVLTDAGGSGLPGTLTYISPKAEFTPRNVQTADQRSRLVYRVKVSVDNTQGVLKSGMPVDAVFPDLSDAAP